MASSSTTVSFIYMKKYASSAMDVAMRLHALYSRTPKKDDFSGTTYNYFMRYENPQGISSRFANAQTNSATSKGKQMSADIFDKYAVIDIDGKSIARCKNNGAILDLVTMETDGVLEELGSDYAFDLYHSYGQRGRRSSASGNVITLTVADDVRNFHEGMTIGADDTATGVSPRSGTTTIAALDEDAGTITLANAAAISGFIDNDYLFRDGDDSTVCFEGLEVCTPLVAPVYLSDSFRGIDRGSNPSKLAGSRLDDTSMTAEEMVGRLATKCAQNKRSITEAYLNPLRFHEIARRQGGKIEYSGGGGEATVGFETLKVATASGVITLVADADCPTNRIRGVNPKSHYLITMGKLPHIITDDGQVSQRHPTADAIQTRVVGRANYIQTNPGDFAVGSVAV